MSSLGSLRGAPSLSGQPSSTGGGSSSTTPRGGLSSLSGAPGLDSQLKRRGSSGSLHADIPSSTSSGAQMQSSSLQGGKTSSDFDMADFGFEKDEMETSDDPLDALLSGKTAPSSGSSVESKSTSRKPVLSAKDGKKVSTSRAHHARSSGQVIDVLDGDSDDEELSRRPGQRTPPPLSIPESRPRSAADAASGPVNTVEAVLRPPLSGRRRSSVENPSRGLLDLMAEKEPPSHSVSLSSQTLTKDPTTSSSVIKQIHPSPSLPIPPVPIPDQDLSSANLNKLDDVSLRVVKERMEASFDAHRLKPGDPNFEYDIQRKFGPPVESSGWDSEGSEGSEDDGQTPINSYRSGTSSTFANFGNADSDSEELDMSPPSAPPLPVRMQPAPSSLSNRVTALRNAQKHDIPIPSSSVQSSAPLISVSDESDEYSEESFESPSHQSSESTGGSKVRSSSNAVPPILSESAVLSHRGETSVDFGNDSVVDRLLQAIDDPQSVIDKKLNDTDGSIHSSPPAYQPTSVSSRVQGNSNPTGTVTSQVSGGNSILRSRAALRENMRKQQEEQVAALREIGGSVDLPSSLVGARISSTEDRQGDLLTSPPPAQDPFAETDRKRRELLARSHSTDDLLKTGGPTEEDTVFRDKLREEEKERIRREHEERRKKALEDIQRERMSQQDGSPFPEDLEQPSHDVGPASLSKNVGVLRRGGEGQISVPKSDSSDHPVSDIENASPIDDLSDEGSASTADGDSHRNRETSIKSSLLPSSLSSKPSGTGSSQDAASGRSTSTTATGGSSQLLTNSSRTRRSSILLSKPSSAQGSSVQSSTSGSDTHPAPVSQLSKIGPSVTSSAGSLYSSSHPVADSIASAMTAAQITELERVVSENFTKMLSLYEGSSTRIEEELEKLRLELSDERNRNRNLESRVAGFEVEKEKAITQTKTEALESAKQTELNLLSRVQDAMSEKNKLEQEMNLLRLRHLEEKKALEDAHDAEISRLKSDRVRALEEADARFRERLEHERTLHAQALLAKEEQQYESVSSLKKLHEEERLKVASTDDLLSKVDVLMSRMDSQVQDLDAVQKNALRERLVAVEHRELQVEEKDRLLREFERHLKEQQRSTEEERRRLQALFVAFEANMKDLSESYQEERLRLQKEQSRTESKQTSYAAEFKSRMDQLLEEYRTIQQDASRLHTEKDEFSRSMIEERRLLAKERAELDDHLRSLVEREGVAREEVSRIESAAALRRVEIEKDMAVAEERLKSLEVEKNRIFVEKKKFEEEVNDLRRSKASLIHLAEKVERESAQLTVQREKLEEDLSVLRSSQQDLHRVRDGFDEERKQLVREREALDEQRKLFEMERKSLSEEENRLAVREREVLASKHTVSQLEDKLSHELEEARVQNEKLKLFERRFHTMEDMENRPPMAVGRSSSGKQSVDDQAISYSNAADGDLDEMHYATWNGVSYGPRVRSSSAGRGGIAIHANKIGVSKRSLVQDDISAHRLSEHPSSSLYRSRDHAYNPSTLRSLPFASDAVGDLIHDSEALSHQKRVLREMSSWLSESENRFALAPRNTTNNSVPTGPNELKLRIQPSYGTQEMKKDSSSYSMDETQGAAMFSSQMSGNGTISDDATQHFTSLHSPGLSVSPSTLHSLSNVEDTSS